MKKTLAVFTLITVVPTVGAQELCHNYDYQELKDMPAGRLSEEYCNVTERLERNAYWEASFASMAESDIKLSRLSREMGNRRAAQEHRDSARDLVEKIGAYAQSKNYCANQQERVLRVLADRAKKRPADSVPVCPKKE